MTTNTDPPPAPDAGPPPTLPGLLREVERLQSEAESARRHAGAILARLRARKGTDGEGRLSPSDIVALKKIAGEWEAKEGPKR